MIIQKSNFKIVNPNGLRHIESVHETEWYCTLEIRENDELFGLGFPPFYVDNMGIRKKRAERYTQPKSRHMGFLRWDCLTP